METAERTDLKRPAAVIALCIIARIAVYCVTHYQVDDALITFRYAENVADGLGFVYNVGEHVCGTTTPLFALLLAALAIVGIAPPLGAVSISLVCAGVTTSVLLRLARKYIAGDAAFLPAIMYALYPRSLISDICGLETACFTMLLVSAIFLLQGKRHWQAGAIAGFAAVTRPEGLGLLAIILVVAVIDKAPRLGRVAVVSLVPLVSWILFALSYFGTVIPSSLVAKSALYGNGREGLIERVAGMMTLAPWPGITAFVLLVAVAIRFAVKRDRSVIITVTAVGLISGLAIFSPRVFFWYAAPALPLVFFAFSRLFATISERLRLRNAAPVAALSMAAVLSLIVFDRISGLRNEVNWYESNHIAAANYLNDHAAKKDIVLAEDIGHLGYRYRGIIVDRDGLVTPQAIDYNRRHAYLPFADSVNADWVFMAGDYPTSQIILNSRSLRERYTEIDYGPSAAQRTHRLFRRK